MHGLISYLAHNRLLANLTLMMVLVGGAICWFKIGKEEMPPFEVPWLRVSVPYPGASAEDVELFVTRPLEDKIKGVLGVKEVSSTSSNGFSSIRIELSDDKDQRSEIISEIKDAALEVSLPDGIASDLKFRQFKSSQKAILDIGVYYEGKHLLDYKARSKLQEYVASLENHLTGLSEVSELNLSGYLAQKIVVELDPLKLKKFDVSASQVARKLQSSHFRVPLGSLEDAKETRLTFYSEYQEPKALASLVVRSGFEGRPVLLSDVASVTKRHEKYTTIYKVQGHEAIILNIKKTSQTDILTAISRVKKQALTFAQSHGSSPIKLVLLDDESYDLQNRLSLVSMNGILGFVLILGVLFLFLDFRSGFWVAMGLPFCLCFCLICLYLMGMTINNMTLAAVIIVIGIVVDDAIIICESISREKSLLPLNASPGPAVVAGTKKVLLPIVAAILTTCVAFMPLAHFAGRFGSFVQSIPVVVTLMLAASLYESICVLPAHLNTREKKKARGNLFFRVEGFYSHRLSKILKVHYLVILAFLGLLVASFYLYKQNMKFVMFPREEAREIFIRVGTPKGTSRVETALKIRQIEDILLADLDKYVVGVRSSVAQSRWGRKVQDNAAFIRVELIPLEERKVPLKSLLSRWEEQTKALQGFENIRFIKGRFGHGSGSPIDIHVLENNDVKRMAIAKLIEAELLKDASLSNVEIERVLENPQFKLQPVAMELETRQVSYESLKTSLRVFLSGFTAYKITSFDEEVDVLLTTPDEHKRDLDGILDNHVENQRGYMVPLRDLVEVAPSMLPSNIQRSSYKRLITVKADLKDGARKTPLEIARGLEQGVLKQIKVDYPSSRVVLKGEVEDSRRSGSDFLFAIVTVVGLIYGILILLYRSFVTPLLIMAIIPFGLFGVVIAFYAHGMNAFGFFAVVGSIGMIGVVINDAIVMIDRLEKKVEPGGDLYSQVASVSSSRLRAVTLTTITTVCGIFPTAYGIAGYDSMLAEMMLAMGWGLLFATSITLLLVPCLYTAFWQIRRSVSRLKGGWG